MRGNRLELVDWLIGQGADVHTPGRARAEIAVLLSPYCVARRYRRHEIAERLLSAGARIDLPSACYLGELE